MANHKLQNYLTLSCFGKVGPRSFDKIAAFFDVDSLSIRKIHTAELLSAGLKPETALELIQFIDQFNFDDEFSKLNKLGITLISRQSNHYPEMLKEVSDSPFILYVMGESTVLSGLNLAVVGSRKHTHYGKQVLEKFIPDLVSCGVQIVSGLAYGIDAIAHKLTLAAEGTTIAVIGSGLDNIYPTDNRALAESILQNGGAIISEYPLGTAPLKQHFPARNRIISGISRGTLVVECDIKSGAMITAHHTIEQNREVFALPGQITSISSMGPNSLIKMGAKPITEAKDIVESFDLRWQGGKEQLIISPVTDNEKQIYDLIGTSPLHVDIIVEQSKLKSDEVGSTLLFLEMKGLIRNIGAANYVRR
jgi:DNA processing protein